jgi:ADP-heptose:LPS heptosyltransferase
VIVHDDIDLYDDFDGMSDLLSSLDLVIGISSVPAELAAALGVKVWFLGFSPENFVLRTSGGRTEIDQLTANAINFTAPDIDFSEPVEICIEKVMDETRRRLSQLLVRKGSLDEGGNRSCPEDSGQLISSST